MSNVNNVIVRRLPGKQEGGENHGGIRERLLDEPEEEEGREGERGGGRGGVGKEEGGGAAEEGTWSGPVTTIETRGFKSHRNEGGTAKGGGAGAGAGEEEEEAGFDFSASNASAHSFDRSTDRILFASAAAAADDTEDSLTKTLYQPSKSLADEAFHCAFAKVWLLSFTTLCKASTTFMWCIEINGASFLYYAANNHCGAWQIPSIIFFMLLLVPPMLVLFFAFLEHQTRQNNGFFQLAVVRVFRLKRLQRAIDTKLCSSPLLRAFFAPDDVYKKGFWWWSHAYALFRAVVVLDFVYGNGNVESSSMLIVIAGLWLAMQLAHWPYGDKVANQLQVS
jgi:hypothetical protein